MVDIPEINRPSQEEQSRKMEAGIGDLAAHADSSCTRLGDVWMCRMKMPVDSLALCTVFQHAFRGFGEAEERTACSVLSQFFTSCYRSLYTLGVACFGSPGSVCTLQVLST